MTTLPPPAPPGNLDTPAAASNARTAGDIRRPILLALDAKAAAWKRLHVAQVEAACGNSDPDELAAAAADNEAAELAFLSARGDMAELFLGFVRNAQADPCHAATARDELGKLAGVPALEQVIAYLGRRLDAAESRAQADRERIAELEDAAARNQWEYSDRGEPAGRSAVTA